jgi:uncharacterized protein YycO
MAHFLTKRQILDFPIRKYQGIRDELKTGDLVFCSGNYIFSKAIQRFTKSVWSHVGMIYRDETIDRVLILESETGIGVRVAPVSKYVRDYHGKNKPYKGNMIIARVSPAPDAEAMKKAICFGLDELTKPYDNWEILRIAVRIMFQITRRSRDRKYICSELIQECYQQAGVKFPIRNTLISPDDIWKDERVMLQFRIM